MTLSRKELNDWENSLNFILDSAYNGFIAVDKDGYIVVFNEPAKNILNIKDNPVGKYVIEIMPDSRLPVILRTGIAELGQKTVINDRLCLANLTPIIKNDEVVGAVCIFEDITLLQNIVEEFSSAREIREILQVLLSSSQDGIMVIDRVNRIHMCNDALCGFLRAEKHTLLGKDINVIFSEISLKNVTTAGDNELNETLNIKGQDTIVSKYPLSNGTDITGVIIKIVFDRVVEAAPLINKINKMRDRLSYYREQLERLSGAKYNMDNIVGKSQVVTQLKETIKKLAPGSSMVLLRGETGTGKELFAHALHLESPRRHSPFVKVSCNSLPENLLETELFGQSDSTGLRKNNLSGKFEIADQGTIFLDEIGDLSLSLQKKLVKVIQQQEIIPVGDDQPKTVDVRIIASTNRNLEDLVKQQLFREDLYYRLNVISFNIPPLRDRREDIEPLINLFIEKYNHEFGKKVIGVSSEVYNVLVKHHWPGNVKELETVMERVFNVIEDQIIQPHHLPVYLKKVSAVKTKSSDNTSLKTLLEETERNALTNTLQSTGGNKVKAARLLGISRAGLYQKLEKYNLLDE